jgi:hypothetical protein
MKPDLPIKSRLLEGVDRVTAGVARIMEPRPRGDAHSRP